MKVEYYYERTQRALDENKMIAPISVEIDLTNVCYQKCYYCNVEQFRAENPDKGTTEDYLKLISSLPKETKDITFAGGGEPLDNHDANIIMNHALKEGFKIGIITNGARLRHLKFSKEYHPTWIGIDFDAGNADLYFKIRKASFPKTISSVKEVIDDLQKFGTKLTFKYLINHYNNSIEQIKEAIWIAQEIRFDEFYVRVAHFKDNTEQVIPPDGEKSWWKLEHQIREECNSLGIDYIGAFAKQEDYVQDRGTGTVPVKQCFAPLFDPIFAANGDIYWCTERRGDKEYVIGNWLKDGISPLYEENLVPKMKDFIKHWKCALSCRYFNYNNFTSKIDKGLKDKNSGHDVGFF